MLPFLLYEEMFECWWKCLIVQGWIEVIGFVEVVSCSYGNSVVAM